MPKLSVIIPSRDEQFLIPTIDDVFRNARGEIEVVAVLDSDKWPANWKEVTDRHPNLHTVHHGHSKGMRAAINSGVASAISRGAKFIMKSDGHCSFSEGFDEVLKKDCESDWVVVPRRGRLDPEAWTATETHKPDIDYHYLSFPDDPNDFGGPGLNGKPWAERAVERKDILLDEEMSSQGSCWFMHASYFTQLKLMDEVNYGPFWNEFQELGLKCWLSGGRVMVNKQAKYLHLHKGKKYGRGYRLPESALKQGAGYTKNWIWNEAWPKQTKPFKWLIEHFWPVPTWPENWEEILYASRKPRQVGVAGSLGTADDSSPDKNGPDAAAGSLVIHSAVYGYDDEHKIDVTERVRELVKGDSLDIVVNNSTLTPNQNPFRGKKKTLSLQYGFDGGEKILMQRQEKDWFIIGPRATTIEFAYEPPPQEPVRLIPKPEFPPRTSAALNDFLIRKFQISPQRLRGPMPIELRDFHRNDLAQLFAELGFKRGAEIGVAEGNYSEVLLKANPECELLLVDPWEGYSGNPQNKTKSKHDFAFTETVRKTEKYPNAKPTIGTSMNTVGMIAEQSLDFVYIDGNHLFDYVIQDLVEWSKRVRSGGIVSGDDYYQLDQKRWVGGGVVEAVQAYTNAHRIPIWFLCNAHRSIDYFWVKP